MQTVPAAGANIITNINVLGPDSRSVEFVLENSTLPIANEFRRILLAEIPTIAIEFVNVEINTSYLNDEYIANRLGAMPLLNINPAEEGLFEFVLDVSAGPVETDVVNFDLQSKNPNIYHVGQYAGVPGQPASYDMSKQIVIGKLHPNQQLKLRCLTQKGIGKTHSKFSPISKLSFREDRPVKPTKFTFTIDLTGTAQIETLLNAALQILQTRLANFKM